MNHDELSARVAKLEKTNRRLIRGAGLAVLAAAGFGLVSARTVCDEVSAERFVLRDAQGNKRALLTAYETGGVPKLALMDKKGRAMATLSVEQDGAFLALADASGEKSMRYGSSAAAGGEGGAGSGCEQKKKCDKSGEGEATVASTN